jgi:hypothetical protein
MRRADRGVYPCRNVQSQQRIGKPDHTTEDTVCSIHHTAVLDSTQHIQQFGWRNLCDRPAAKSREDVTVETPDGANSMAFRRDYRIRDSMIATGTLRLSEQRSLSTRSVRAAALRARVARGGRQALTQSQGMGRPSAYTHTNGIHIDDLPAAQNLTLPEEPHLSRACATVFTDAYTRALAHRTQLLHLKPDAPPTLSTQDCVRPTVASPN